MNELTRRALRKGPLWLFLDYDGTLADFAPTPETVEPDPKINSLVRRLASNPALRLSIISGRRLRDVRVLITVPGIFLAGTYGVELLTPNGTLIQRVDQDVIRPFLETIKPKWHKIIEAEKGFYIEDKDWALALHAKLSQEEDAKRVLALAREVVEHNLPEEQFRILGGHKFLEVAPLLAHKGKTVSYLLDQFPFPEAQLLYIGDDDKDEEAFEVIDTHGGFCIKVTGDAQAFRSTRAKYTLDSPAAVTAWLETLSSQHAEN